ncbi:hypothetical protein GGD38_001487 [Chitinophagaceae bacterium OAS944]|nr:hypothetical protein [Chitinophagaceae bacterium OAS944]
MKMQSHSATMLNSYLARASFLREITKNNKKRSKNNLLQKKMRLIKVAFLKFD